VDSVNVTVVDTEPPVALAGEDIRVDQGTEVTLDGSASRDNVGVVDHTWYLSIESNEVLGVGPVLEHTFHDPGRYVVRLEVRDAAGNAAHDEVTIVVVDAEDPVAEAGEDLVVDQGEEFTLDGGGSEDNVGVTGWLWTYDVGGGTVNVTSSTTSVRVTDTGTYVFLLTVEDAEGNRATDEVSVRVRDSTPPVADAGEDVTVEEGTRVALSAAASTDNVGVVGYRWTFEYGGRDVGLEGCEADFRFGRPGTYRVTLTVEDAEGNTGEDTVTVEVTSVDVSGEPPSYILLLVVAVVVVATVLWRVRSRGR
jgi:PKD repeat protein